MINYTNFENDKKIGEKIRKRRRELKLTQKDCSEYLHCSPQQIQKYEDGITKLSLENFLKLCEKLHTHPSYFFSEFKFHENTDLDSNYLEERLIAVFRSVSNKKLQAKIIDIIEAVVSSAS